MVVVIADDHLAAAIVPLKGNRTISTSLVSIFSIATEKVDGDGVADTIEISNGEIPLTGDSDNVDSVIHFFYSTLEIGAEVVSESMTSAVTSIVPSCDGNPCSSRSPEKKEGGETVGPTMHTAMELYGTLEIGAEVVSEGMASAVTSIVPSCGGNPCSSKSPEKKEGDETVGPPMPSVMELLVASSYDDSVRTEGTHNSLLKAEKYQEVKVEVVQQVEAQSSFDGGGCFMSVFACPDNDGQEDKDLLNEIEDIEDSLSKIKEIKKRHADPFINKMATVKQYLLLQQQHTLFQQYALEDIDDTRKNYYRSRATLINAEVERRRAELELMKIRLESVRVDKEMMLMDSMMDFENGSFDDTVDSSFDTLMTEETVGEEGIQHAYQVFAKYTTNKFQMLRQSKGKGLWRVIAE